MPPAIESDASDIEIAALAQVLEDTQRRLRELTNDDVDAVLSRSGQSFLLLDAERKLRESEAIQRTLAEERGKSERKFANLLESAPDATLIFNDRGRIVLSNSKAQQLFGWSQAALLDLTVESLIPVRLRGKHAFLPEDFFAGSSSVSIGQGLDLHGLRKDGTEFPMESTQSAVETDDGVLVSIAIRDITERQRIEEALSKSEEDFRTLAEAVPQIVWVTRPDGWTTFFNDRWMSYTGLTLEESLGRGWNRPFHPDERQQAWEEWQRAIASGREYSIECRLRRSDGVYRWWLMRGLPMRDNAGSILKWFGTCTDIDDMKKAELENIRMNRALKMLSGGNQVLIRSTSEADLLENICKVIVEAGGYRMAWVGFGKNDSNRSITPMAHAGFEDGFLSQYPRTWTKGESAGDGPCGRVIRSGQMVVCEDLADDPTYAPLLESAGKRGYRGALFLPLGNAGKTFGVLVLYSSETVRPSADEIALLNEMADDLAFGIIHLQNQLEHKKTEERFRRVVESNSQGVLFWNATGDITSANDNFLRLTGYTKEDVKAGLLNWIAMTPPEFLETSKLNREQLAATGAAVPLEKEYICKNGARVPVLVCVAAFSDNHDEGVSFVFDLTEQKKIEKQLFRSQRLESVGTLASGIAHDLNNVLAPIMMSVALLKGKVAAGDEASNRLLDMLEDNARRGANLIRQVLGFARGFEGERILIQPLHIVHEIEQVVRETFPKNIEFRFKSPRGIWTILGDPTQLHQVLLNLCVNARDAMPAEGRLSIEVENVTIDDVFVRQHPGAKAGRFVMLNVRDTGNGIPQEVQEKIFEPFFTTKEQGKGTGLGLSTVLALVTSHGGFLVLESTKGLGSSFRVYFPASLSTNGEGDKNVGNLELTQGGNQLILLVDDEEPIRIIATKILERYGYRVLQAKNGAEALSIYAINREDISVVVTDMAMPVMDGPSTIAALKLMNPKVKIISSSGVGSMAASGATASFKVGEKFFIAKPYTAQSLLAALDQIIGTDRTASKVA